MMAEPPQLPYARDPQSTSTPSTLTFQNRPSDQQQMQQSTHSLNPSYMYDENGGVHSVAGGQGYDEIHEEVIEGDGIDPEAHGVAGSALQYWTAPRHGKGKGRSRTDEEYCKSLPSGGLHGQGDEWR